MSEKEDNKLETLKNSINEKLKESGVQFKEIIEVEDGQYSVDIDLNPKKSEVAGMLISKNDMRKLIRDRTAKNGSLVEAFSKEKELQELQTVLELARAQDQEENPNVEYANLDVRYRDILDNSNLDLRPASVDQVNAKNLYERASKEYKRTGIYGTTVDRYTSFSAAGFFNEVDDPEIKEFYDAWVNDTNFEEIVNQIFYDLYKFGVTFPYAFIGKYEPNLDGISSIPGKSPSSAAAASKIKAASLLKKVIRANGNELDYKAFSQKYNEQAEEVSDIPISFTLLDPTTVTYETAGVANLAIITGGSKTFAKFKKILGLIQQKKASDAVKEFFKNFPSKLKAAIAENKDYVFSDQEIFPIFLRRNEYENFAIPKATRVFDAFDYKDELKKADLATVDGIYNYILKVTVGDKDNPVRNVQVLSDLAEAFNTPQKAFSVIWNHTLSIEKITTNDIGAILGKEKYEPVESDITAGLGIARALIDGGDINEKSAVLISNAIQSDINAARKKVEIWIYKQYKLIAKQAGFQKFPKVRWKSTVVSTDSPAVANASWVQMLDRKAISIQTYMREQGLDFDTEVLRMGEELELINQGVLQAGSPFQQSGDPETTLTTPSSADQGRPQGQKTLNKKPKNPTKVLKEGVKVKGKTLESAVEELKELDPDIEAKLIEALSEIKASTKRPK